MPEQIKVGRSWIILLLLLPGIAAAGVYKWTDENGKVHFGDRPPETGAKEIPIKQAPPAENRVRAREQLDRQQKLLDAYDEERQIKAKDRAKAEKLKARREKNCRIARARAEKYRTSTYLYEQDEAGNKKILSHAQRAAAEEKARADVAHWCK